MMKILLDECLPKKLKNHLTQYDVHTVPEMGWNSVKNGDLLSQAVDNGFDILMTIDKNLEYQQDIPSFNITIVIFDVSRSKIEFLSPLLAKFNELEKKIEKKRVYRLS